MKRVKQIRCPAPLPKEPVSPRLAKMLVLAPYTALAKKATGKAKGSGVAPAARVLRTRHLKTRPVPPSPKTTTMRRRRKTLPLMEGGRRGRPPKFWTGRRPRRGKARSRAAPHGTSTAVRSDAPALSLRPHRKCQESYMLINLTSPLCRIDMINYAILVRPMTAPAILIKRLVGLKGDGQ